MSKLLITGGTGSFGTAMLERAIKDQKYSEIRVFSRDEKKQFDLMNRFSSPWIKFLIGDVRDMDSVMRATDGVDLVFHAAALKHVPTGEFFPIELVRTNILGTENVFAAAKKQGVKKVVLLSTDKAVYPINAMGMTKALAEKLMSAYAMDNSATVYCAVRYGNVMASRGSVIPLFVDQIKNGKGITITNPVMTRFLLSLDDSINLVEFALHSGEQGNLFIKKSPAATVEVIGKALMDLFDSKKRIKIVGTRKGEKIHEALASGVELTSSDDLGDFFKIKTRGELDYNPYINKGDTSQILEDYTSENTTRLDLAEAKRLLMKLPFIKTALKNEKTSSIV